MSDGKNKHTRLPAPPAPLFLGKAERDFVKQVNDELLETVIPQQVVYYPLDLDLTQYNPTYGEAIEKTFLSPVIVKGILIEWEGLQTVTTNFGPEQRASIVINFHKKRITDDQDLYIRVGDFVLYGKIYYEIVTAAEPRELFGQQGHRFEIQAKCIQAREGLFDAC